MTDSNQATKPDHPFSQESDMALRMAILNALPAHIALLDHYGNIVVVNDAWRHFASANIFPGENFAIGQNYLTVCDSSQGDCAEEAQEAAAGIRAVLAGNLRVFTLEYPCHSPDEKRWFRLMVTPANEGSLNGAVVMHINITDRKLAEEHLREKESLLRIAGKLTQTGGWAVYAPTNAIFWSDGLCEMLGYPIGAYPSLEEGLELYTPQSRTLITNALQKCLSEGTPFDVELEIFTKLRVKLRVRCMGEAERDSQGKILRVQGAMQDITGLRVLEEQLRQSQRLDSIGQLTGGVAHDFNNLLTVIMGNADIIADELGSESDLGSMAEMINNAAQQGAQLTSQLLAFARQQTLEPQTVDINMLMRDTTELLRRTIGEDIVVQIKAAPALHHAMVDPAQLKSVLLNLCINARDAMPEGGHLIIETANRLLDQDYIMHLPDLLHGDYVMLAVSDTGHGIPEANLKRVFEPFFTTKEKSKGTGLGLSMVYGFVKQSHGHVTLYSEEGQGTTVKLFLPRSFDGATSDTEASTIQSSPRGTQLILLVEDNDLVRTYVHNQLLSFGYRVIVTENGAEALTAIQDNPQIDLLFTDIVMPGGMNGRQLAEQAQTIRPGLKVLYTSGYTENALTHKGRLEPGVHLLSKPYRRDELARQLQLIFAS